MQKILKLGKKHGRNFSPQRRSQRLQIDGSIFRKQQDTPWDAGKSQPGLRTLLDSKELDLPATGKALVPGCGTGYDAIVLGTTLGYEVLGLDISATAIEKARRRVLVSLSSYRVLLMSRHSLLQSAALEDPSLAPKVQFQDVDFFDLNPSDDSDKFDLVYDYTFFVAIPPSRRPSWGTQMNELVKQNGHLITLISPMIPYTDVGPPFYVRPEHYPPVLGDGWEKVVDREPENSSENHVVRQRLVVWRKL
ncbi:hypothetical protein V5O48_005240 [Marasmius crinis-equi]|uniref:Thiol methyltransferase 2 n=1 Tax=Marasmius crinis-equi TaxID=585013 RepID=A0ABR3FMV2_9AGAR